MIPPALYTTFPNTMLKVPSNFIANIVVVDADKLKGNFQKVSELVLHFMGSRAFNCRDPPPDFPLEPNVSLKITILSLWLDNFVGY